MLNKIIVLFLLLFPILIKASETKFTCYSQTNYGYINGIKNENKQVAVRGAINIENKLKLDQVETIYNRSSLGGVKDLVDSFHQKIEEASILGSWRAKVWLATTPWVEDNRKEIFSMINSLQKPNEKLVIFSHSQGNLYANLACEKFGRDAFENIQIATPSSYIGCGEPTHYTSIKKDEMLFMTGKLLREPASLMSTQ